MARKCLLNSLDNRLQKDLQIQIKETDCFTVILMVFIDYERPLTGEMYAGIEAKIKSATINKYPQGNVSMMVTDIRQWIDTLHKANMYDSKDNIALCRILAVAGGDNNIEYTGPMYKLLEQCQEALPKITPFNNAQKHAYMVKKVLITRQSW